MTYYAHRDINKIKQNLIGNDFSLCYKETIDAKPPDDGKHYIDEED